MKTRSVVLALLVSAAMVAGAAEVVSEKTLTASQLDLDVTKEEVNLQDLELKVGSLAVLRARTGSFRVDSADVPRVLDVGDATISFSNRTLLISGEATYYSELRTLVADAVQIAGPPVITAAEVRIDRRGRSLTGSDFTVSSSGGNDSYTCSGGTLYENGVAVPGNSVCRDMGSGGVLISCSEGGNRVQMQLLDQNCPLTE